MLLVVFAQQFSTYTYPAQAPITSTHTMSGVPYKLRVNFVFLCVKSKETYYARCQELDKSKKDGSSPKEIEKVSPSDIIFLMILTCLQRAHYSIHNSS